MNPTSQVLESSRASEVAGESESLWQIIRRTCRESSAEVRGSASVIVVGGTVTILAQTGLDWDQGRGAEGVMQTLCLSFGWAGMMLLAITAILQGASQRFAGARHAGTRIGLQRLHPMLVVSPLLALGAASLIGVAVGTGVSRAVARSPWMVVLVLPLAIFIAFAGRLVIDSCRFLFNHAREQAELANRARAEVSEAQLSTLTAQLHPHYLFNALNTIASLIKTDPSAAERTVENVARVLRKGLDRSQRTCAPLSEEIDYLKAFLAVEKERWGERLEVSWSIAPGTLNLYVPPLVLQPLVENALRHGLGERLEGGRIEIAARVEEGRLRLAVTDDGLGLAAEIHERTGLGTLRRRLVTLYGEAGELRLERNQEGGTRAVVLLPLESRPERG